MSRNNTSKPDEVDQVHIKSVRNNSRWFSNKALMVMALFVIIFGGIGLRLQTQSKAANCSVSATLVNSCHPWQGAFLNNYPSPLVDKATGATVCADTSSWTAAMNCSEKKAGRKWDIWHMYNGPKAAKLSAQEVTAAKRANTYLYLNWTPTNTWADATGCGTSACKSMDTNIDNLAADIKAVAPKKLFLSIMHEPENDIEPGGDPNCPNVNYVGTKGTVKEYVAMWHHIRARFDAAGVNNVVWTMNYMGYAGYNCMVKDLWPGNSYVDWITWDPYGSGNDTWSSNISPFYNYLTSNSTSSSGTFDVLDKPWGLAEFGTHKMSQANVYNFYNQAITAIHNNTFPRLHMYLVFDDPGPKGDNRLYFDDAGNQDPKEQDAFNKWVNDKWFTDEFYESTSPPSDTSPPAASITSPSSGANVAKTIDVEASASDDIGVTSVSLYVDNTSVATDNSSPYSFSLDTTKYSDGSHTLKLVARDAAGNTATSTGVNITVNNSTDTTPPVISIASPKNNATVSGKVSITSSLSDNVGVAKVSLYRDKTYQEAVFAAPFSFLWDTTTDANGWHTMSVLARDAAGNVTRSAKISVYVKNDNSPPVLTVSGLVDGSLLRGNSTITVSATDNTKVSNISVSVDGTEKASGSTDYLSFRLNAKSLQAGTHKMQFTATDPVGNSSSKTLSFTTK